jgi:integrase
MDLAIVRPAKQSTIRRTYSTLLRASGAELKVMQELMRHSTIRVTLDTYTQAGIGGRKRRGRWFRHKLVPIWYLFVPTPG